VFRTWSFLEGLFIHSEEVKKELPKESIKFIEIDKSVKAILTEAFKIKKPLEFCVLEHVFPGLEKAQQDLSVCEKALNEFLETKKLQFPRFFFVSTTDLLDILSNGNIPSKIMVHMPKIISAIETLELIEEGVRPFAKSIHSYVGVENVAFTEPLKLMGKVEVYLQDVIDTMRKSLLEISRRSLKKFGEIDKETWLKQDPAMVTLLINCCQWVVNVERGFSKIPTKKDAMRDIWDG
jgi:dynein heavy chain